MSVVPLSDTRLELGESSIWAEIDGAGTWLWIDILGPALFVLKDGETAPRKIDLPSGAVGTVVPVAGKKSSVLVALRQSLALVDLESGDVKEVCRPPADALPPAGTDWRFNDGKVGPDGRFWVGTMGQPPDAAVGTLFVLEPAKEGEGSPTLVPVLTRAVTISNGISWAKDGSTMFYIDTPSATVVAFDYSPGCLELKNKRVAVQFRKRKNEKGDDECEGGWPDGCCMDGKNRLWVARWSGGKVSCFDVSGFVSSSLSPALDEIECISLPAVTRISSVAIGGTSGDDFLITTAQEGMSEAEKKEEKEANAGKTFLLRRTGLAESAGFATPCRLYGEN